ncbi:MAG: flagellar export chaperone FlgN [Opitutae bacterium]|nr:flagellar export chaperone FlgN [Opitutae bacterium]
MNPVWHSITEALRSEITEYGALLHLFEEQQQRLFARDPEAVLRLSTDIEAQVRILHDSRRRREELVSAYAVAHGHPAGATLRSLLPNFVAEVRPLLEAMITEVNVLIHRVRRVSRHNHTLLARSVDAQQQLLRQLKPDAFTQTYAPNGRVSMTTTARPSPALQAAG